jgi:hypothetical protein
VCCILGDVAGIMAGIMIECSLDDF